MHKLYALVLVPRLFFFFLKLAPVYQTERTHSFLHLLHPHPAFLFYHLSRKNSKSPLSRLLPKFKLGEHGKTAETVCVKLCLSPLSQPSLNF